MSAEHTSRYIVPVFALVEAGHVAADNLDNSRRCSQMRARYRIYGSSSSAMASIS